MIPEGFDIIIYTTKPPKEVIFSFLKSVSSKWRNMQGFLIDKNSDISKDFINLPSKHDLSGNNLEVFVYKDEKIKNKAEELGLGVKEDIDKNMFQLIYTSHRMAKLDVLVKDQNEAFRNLSFPNISFKVDSYDAFVCCPELFQITLVVSEEPKMLSNESWLIETLMNICLNP